MVRRNRKVILESATYEGIFQNSSGNLAILEVLLDIRDILEENKRSKDIRNE